MMAKNTNVRARDIALMGQIADRWACMVRIRLDEVVSSIAAGVCDDAALEYLNEACEQLTIATQWLPTKGGK